MDWQQSPVLVGFVRRATDQEREIFYTLVDALTTLYKVEVTLKDLPLRRKVRYWRVLWSTRRQTRRTVPLIWRRLEELILWGPSSNLAASV